MKFVVVKLEELDDLLENYNDMAYTGETFSHFVYLTKDDGVPICREMDDELWNNLRTLEELEK